MEPSSTTTLSTASDSSTGTTTTSAELQLKLHGTWACQFTHRVELALKLKGLAFEFTEEELHAKSNSILHCSPIYKKVPVLVHDGRAIAESVIILQYIDEVWPDVNRIMPLDPFERAIVRFWCNFSDEMLGPTIGMVFQSVGHRQEAALEQVRQVLKVVEVELRKGFFKGRRFFGGDRIGVLDIVLGAGSYWLSVFETILNLKIIDEDAFPRFTSWMRDFEGVEEVRAITPPMDAVLEYAAGLRKMIVMSSNGDTDEAGCSGGNE